MTKKGELVRFYLTCLSDVHSTYQIGIVVKKSVESKNTRLYEILSGNKIYRVSPKVYTIEILS